MYVLHSRLYTLTMVAFSAQENALASMRECALPLLSCVLFLLNIAVSGEIIIILPLVGLATVVWGRVGSV